MLKRQPVSSGRLGRGWVAWHGLANTRKKSYRGGLNSEDARRSARREKNDEARSDLRKGEHAQRSEP